MYTMDHPDLIASNFMENPIDPKRVKTHLQLLKCTIDEIITEKNEHDQEKPNYQLAADH